MDIDKKCNVLVIGCLCPGFGGTCFLAFWLCVFFEKSLALTWRVVNGFEEHGTRVGGVNATHHTVC